MPIEDIVNVTITKQTASTAKASFGIPLIASYHTKWVDLVHVYKSSSALATLVSEGFAVSDPTYQAMQALLSANPKPKTVKVGRRATTWTQLVRLTPSAVNSTVYAGKVNGLAWTFTSDSSATLTEVCTGVAAAITALADVTASGASATTVDITADAAAKLFDLTYTSGPWSFEDITPATGVVTDVTAIRAADPAFGALVLDVPSTLVTQAVAAWAETIGGLIFGYSTADRDVGDPAVTTDVFSVLKGLKYARTWGIYSEKASAFPAASWMSVVLPFDPGAATWAFKQLVGVAVSSLSATFEAAITAKFGNFYVAVGDDFDTRWGITASGEYIDTTQAIDWSIVTMSQRVFSWLRSAPKRSYTDGSVSGLKSEMAAVLSLGIKRNVIASDPAPVIDAPAVLDVDPSDREGRHLPDVTFSYRLAGAIHTIDIAGTVAV